MSGSHARGFRICLCPNLAGCADWTRIDVLRRPCRRNQRKASRDRQPLRRRKVYSCAMRNPTALIVSSGGGEAARTRHVRLCIDVFGSRFQKLQVSAQLSRDQRRQAPRARPAQSRPLCFACPVLFRRRPQGDSKERSLEVSVGDLQLSAPLPSVFLDRARQPRRLSARIMMESQLTMSTEASRCLDAA